ncbi:DNA-binding protein [Mycobacteroides abscessus]|uniref:helix-turn-helix domain-containing protein n=1 Tax=Mycobacteroides abscessus TaxID=36809 RepID=UPI000E687B77|nr:helix-turn-helix domain-containing protein [Mycobacteroides abscessus]RIS02727.1 DNA-binding protein [Mycobacteroides abscessus]RIS67496.1 DNA-binding protein [Mycobacteroides abscessus]
MTEPADPDELTLYTIPEAIAHLRIGSSLFYKLMATGTIRPLRLGHRTLIPATEIRRLIDEATDRDR